MIKTIYLIHHTHMDIGYTDLPDEVMSRHLIHLDRAIEFCGKDPEYRWFLESSFLVKNYLRNRGTEAAERLFRLLGTGQLELGAFEMQPLTELPDCRSLIGTTAFSRTLAAEHGFPCETACINDIGGYAGRLPTVLSDSGIRNLIAGIGAFQVNLPWAKELPFLFRLKAKDGKSVLVWNLGISRTRRPQDEISLKAVYGSALAGLIQPALARLMPEIMERGTELDVPLTPPDDLFKAFRALEKRLEEENYPYSEIMIQFGGDNRGPAPYLAELVRRMNRLGKLPKIVLCNPDVFFRFMEENHGADIPVLAGAFTDPWNLRTMPSPAGLKRFLQAGRGEFHAGTAAENLQLYADHTCGLSEWGWEKSFRGCRGRGYDRYRESWRAKAFYADSALREVRGRDSESMQKLCAEFPGECLLTVRNRQAVTLSGPVEVYSGRDGFDLSGFADAETGTPVPCQLLSRHRYLLDVSGVPPRSFKKFVPVPGPEHAAHCAASAVPGTVAAPFFTVAFDPRKGLMKSVRLPDGSECWNSSPESLLPGEPLVEFYREFRKDSIGAGMMHERYFTAPMECRGASMTENGPVRKTVASEFRALLPEAEIGFEVFTSVYLNQPRIDLSIRMDHPETAEKHVAAVCFPFAGGPLNCRFEQNLGSIDPCRDLLPGAMQEVFLVSGCMELRSEKVRSVFIPADAPCVSFGKPDLTAWEQEFPFTRPDNTVYGVLYHNLANTDCPIWQDVMETFRYSVYFVPEGGECDIRRFALAPVSLEGAFLSAGRRTVPMPRQISLDRAPGIRFHGIYEDCFLLENTTGGTLTVPVVISGVETSETFAPFELRRIQAR